jgi:hypothetical protein
MKHRSKQKNGFKHKNVETNCYSEQNVLKQIKFI